MNIAFSTGMKNFGLIVTATLALSALNLAHAGPTKKNNRVPANETHATTANKSQASASTSVGQSAKPNWSFNYTSFLSGPPVSDLRSDETAATRDGFTVGLSLQNQLGVRYWFNKQLSVMPVFDFDYQFTDPHETGENKGASLAYDSFVKLKYIDALAGYVQGNKLSLDLEGRYYVPVSEWSRVNESLGSIRLAAIPGIDFAGGSWQISSLLFYRYWMQSHYYQLPTKYNPVAKNTVGLPEHTFYAGPQVSYRYSKTLNFWTLFEASYTLDTLGFNSATDPRRSNVDIEPGLDIRIMNGVYVSPYLNWYVSQPLDTTSINLITSITI